MDNELAKELVRKVDVLISLTAVGALQGKNQKEQIEALSRAGLTPKVVAQLVGTSANTVSVTLSQLKKAKKATKISKP